MWTTIITTFIIAVTTLTGVLVAQWRASVNEDRKRQHERMLRTRDYRRQVYVNLVTATGKRDAPSNQAQAQHLARELGVALATMRITSTQPVTDAAQPVYDMVWDHLHRMHDGNEKDRLYAVQMWDSERYRNAIDAFIEAARREDHGD
jgi:hypothetical protein